MSQTLNTLKDEKLKTKSNYLTKHNATSTCTEFPIKCLRSRVKSID